MDLQQAIETGRQMREQGKKYPEIAEFWKKEGIKSDRTGKPYNPVTVRYLITDGGNQKVTIHPETSNRPIQGASAQNATPQETTPMTTPTINTELKPSRTEPPHDTPSKKILHSIKKILDIPGLEEEHAIKMMRVLMDELELQTIATKKGK